MRTCADVSWFSSTESSLVFILSTSTLIPLQIQQKKHVKGAVSVISGDIPFMSGMFNLQ